MAGNGLGNHETSLWICDQTLERDLAALVESGIACNRHLTAAIQSCIETSFSQNTIGGVGMMQGCDQGFNADIAHSTLDSDSPLTCGRQTDLRIQPLGNLGGFPQPDQTRCSQDDGVQALFLQLFKASSNVASQRDDSGLGKIFSDLRLPSQAGSSDSRILGKSTESLKAI